MSIRSVLVGLDLTEMDEKLISYSSQICQSVKAEHIYFLHVAKNLELPEETLKDYNDILTSVDEGIEHQIRNKISKILKEGIEVSIDVQEGNAVEKMLRFAKIKNVDLVILGRKKSLKGTGVIPDSIARKSPCDLLLVPEKAHEQLVKIVVPIDFSKHSHLAAVEAYKIADANNASVKFVNIFHVPSGYSKAGKTFEEFTDIMKGHAKKDFEKFISKYDREATFDAILSKNNDFEDELAVYIESTKPDLVIIGSKGRTDASVVLLGSMAEKLTKTIRDVPLFIVKKKGESINIFEALLKI